MIAGANWLLNIETESFFIDGLVPVLGYDRDAISPEQVFVMEKAEAFGAHSVFFETSRNGRPPVAQAFIFVSEDSSNDLEFAKLHRRLWSWGGVPLLYRKKPGLIQLFRCAHEPDFLSADGKKIICNPIKILETAVAINNNDAWWDASRLRNGTLWDDPKICKTMLSATGSAHRRLIQAVKNLHDDLNKRNDMLPKPLQRKLLILSLLIAYLEERKALPSNYFHQFLDGATRFFDVLSNGNALVNLLSDLELKFNGDVFTLKETDRNFLQSCHQLARFAEFIGARTERQGQMTLWKLYSFEDLPVELISHIYQVFTNESDDAFYTPPFLVRLILEEVLNWDRMTRLHNRGEVVLDPCCGSGAFLVEAYKRLILHWRSHHNWKVPSVSILKYLLNKVHGIDVQEGAIELTAFSLCLALCDALRPKTIHASNKLFPKLEGMTIHRSCFFDAKDKGLLKDTIGVIVGNPPFKSSLNTEGAERSYKQYKNTYGHLPDKQLAYLFLHDAMELVTEGGVVGMLQQQGFIYNQQSLGFRRDFIRKWDVREILDFISVRGLFQKSGADPKVIIVLANASTPPEDRKILHATFRRSGRVDAEQGFDIDYYDLHWLPRQLTLTNDRIWRADLFGGGRVLSFIDRLKSFRTFKQYAEYQGWDFGEGFIAGSGDASRSSDHLIGQALLPTKALTSNGIDDSMITMVPDGSFEGPRSAKRFTPPMLLIREQMDLPHAIWDKSYLTYKAQVVGFCAPREQVNALYNLGTWFKNNKRILQAFVAATSTSLFSRRATSICADEIFALPYPENGDLDLSVNEQILVDDILDYYRDIIRYADKSDSMMKCSVVELSKYATIFSRQINAVYKKKPLRSLESQVWPGIICQPFVFGDGEINWTGSDQLKNRLNTLLTNQHESSLHISRIARIYDGPFIFLLKPDRLRYWLRSIALRDADETLVDLRNQGF